jgi:hypothetical protein
MTPLYYISFIPTVSLAMLGLYYKINKNKIKLIEQQGIDNKQTIDDMFFEKVVSSQKEIEKKKESDRLEKEEREKKREIELQKFKQEIEEQYLSRAFLYLSEELAKNFDNINMMSHIRISNLHLKIQNSNWQTFINVFTAILNQKNIKYYQKYSNVDLHAIYIDGLSLHQYFNRLKEDRTNKPETITTAPYR